MARKLGLQALRELAAGVARDVVGAIAVDNASLVDANYPVAPAINCAGFDTIMVGVEIVGGASPTITVEALFRDAEAADGARWKRFLLGAKDGITAIATPISEDTGALVPAGAFAELRVYGHPLVFLRASAVANAGSTTSWKILALPGRKSAR